MAVTIDDDPRARPALLLIVDAERILAGEIVSRPSADPVAIAVTLEAAIRKAIAGGGRPKRITVRHASVAGALGERLQSEGIAVRAGHSLP